MFGLTTLGAFHTLVSLVALFFGIYALAKYKEISPKNRAGQVYLVATLVTAVTALGIFQHGGFGKPHVLAILTLIALLVGTVAATTRFYGRASRYVQVIAYSATFLFHLIPGFTESLTRLPLGAPLVASQEAPIIQVIAAVLFVAYLIGVALQIRRIRAAPAHLEGDEELGKTS
jgi:uncharacterized membrane protein